MCSMAWTMLHWLVVLILSSLVESQRIILRSGRHVCKQEKTVLTPIASTKTVCVPFYQRSYLPCHYPNRGLCPFVRLMYRTEYRRVNEMVPRRHAYFSCCPGWTGYDVRNNACAKPVCNPRCHHGGNCRLPNRCKCPDGWNGTSCQSDVDECKSSPCDQKCTNTDGSFRCECFQGYRLSTDGHSCTLCLSCTDEFTSILQEQKRLQKSVKRLEEHNHILMTNLTSLHQDLINLTSLTQPTHLPPTPPPEEKGPTAEDISDELDAYMSSISEQIAMLEERLDVCTCTKNYRMGMGIIDQRMTPVRTSSTERRLKANSHRERTTISSAATTTMTTTEKDYLLYRAPSK